MSRIWDGDQARKRSKFAFYGNFACVPYAGRVVDDTLISEDNPRYRFRKPYRKN